MLKKITVSHPGTHSGGFPGGSAVKNLLAIQKTQARSLSQEDPLPKEMQSTPIFLPGKSHGQTGLAGYSPWGHKSQTRLSD